MTREEQAFEASKRFEESLTEKDLATLSKDDMCFAFQLGVKWAESHPKSPWMSVEEELPRQDEEVIVLCDDLNVAPNYKISFGHIVDKTICQDYNGWNIPNVVYWFPMKDTSMIQIEKM